jgi:hypothetical protein
MLPPGNRIWQLIYPDFEFEKSEFGEKTLYSDLCSLKNFSSKAFDEEF